MKDCPFCLENQLLSDPIMTQTRRAYLIKNTRMGIPEAYLVIPRDHIEKTLPEWWQQELNQLVEKIPRIESAHYNESTNFGKVAGQTLAHLHTHVILRSDDQGNLGLGGLLREYSQNTPLIP